MTHESPGSEVAALQARLARQLEQNGLRLVSTSGEVELVRLEEADAPRQFRLIEENRQHLREWLGWLDVTIQAENLREFIADARSRTRDEGAIEWAIRHRGEPVGVMSFHEIAWPERLASIGYWLAKPATGRGLATTALRTVVEFAFDTLGLKTLRARIAPGNVRSAAVVRRLGFRVVGVIDPGEELYGRTVAHEVFELENPAG
ncbi:ribosomal-protein-serine acetyltransferase [Nannocystis exedens]|uniref:Ribosomal-protein-serine acetyltransferase n=1 Tax=Nannocystis exedens TaxID=54 RepID=A0A1I2ERM2_9BACT|nr:GNAT family N-acetyltransferase [Nannocystis exedens]PCC73855.1 GNAT family N-acetyltransferase [Nannocystis exedens]SFE95267.1 ribosomal-protein-serine acetyltransferase [Nannocystis exedens]